MDLEVEVREVVIEVGPARSARVVPGPELPRPPVVVAAEAVDAGGVDAEARGVPAGAGSGGVAPDEEDLVDRAQRIELELVVGVAAVDEELEVVLEEQEVVALR